MKSRTCLVTLGFGLLIGLNPGARAAEPAASSVTLKIDAQPLRDALSEFGRQSGLQVVFIYTDINAAITSSHLAGTYSPQAALEQLLTNTSLSYEFINPRTVAIRRVDEVRKEETSWSATPDALNPTAGSASSRLAQTSAPNSPSTSAARANPAEDRVDRVQLEEIIVTAQKRKENVREVPISISVISSEHLEQFHATQLFDFAKYIPGVQISNIGRPGLNSVTLRGISPIGPNQTVGVYIDDAPVGSSGSFAAEGSMTTDLLPYDIERIEVLRGPQGTLYGASGNAGLLKYVTRAPDLSSFEVRAGTEVYDMESASDVGWAGRLGINAPLVEGKVAVRASYGYLRTPGYIDNIVLGIQDQNELSQEAGRVALLWQASDEVTLKLAGMWQTIDSENRGVSLLNSPLRTAVADGHSLDNQLPEPFERDMRHYTATLDWALDWADFVSATSYSDTKTRLTSDASANFGSLFPIFGSLPGLSQFFLDLDLEKWTQEFRLTSPSGPRVEWLLGAFYTDEDSSNGQIASALTLAGDPITALNPFAVSALPSQYQEYAVFGNLTYKFTERFDVTAGLRWARNEQNFRGSAGGPLFLLLGLAAETSGESSESVMTYSLAPRLRLNEDTMIYARVANGYRPGGPNVVVPGARPQSDSDLLTSYEVGVKTEFLQGRAMIDAAIFRMDWQDIQVTVAGAAPNDDISFGDNAGEAWSQGVELATIFTPVKALQLGVNAAYAETELTELSPRAVSFPGRPGDSLPFVPKWSASATADYEFPLRQAWRGRVGAGYRYVGERRSGFDSDPRALSQDSYEALDLNAEIYSENWTFRLFATNVTDEPGQIRLDPANNPAFLIGALLPPRIVGLSLDVIF